MNDMKTNPHKFHAFLMEVYKGEKANAKLIAKHKISNRTQQACRFLNYTDEYNCSKMNTPPTIEDAIRLIKKNAQMQKISQKKHRAKKEKIKGQLQLGLPVKKREKREPRKTSKLMQIKPSSAKEISIMWGLIKITL
jgi:hypothetical protein